MATHETTREGEQQARMRATKRVQQTGLVGIGLFAVATVMLFAISLPLTPLSDSLGALAALLLALGTLLIGTTTTGRARRNRL